MEASGTVDNKEPTLTANEAHAENDAVMAEDVQQDHSSDHSKKDLSTASVTMAESIVSSACLSFQSVISDSDLISETESISDYENDPTCPKVAPAAKEDEMTDAEFQKAEEYKERGNQYFKSKCAIM